MHNLWTNVWTVLTGSTMQHLENIRHTSTTPARSGPVHRVTDGTTVRNDCRESRRENGGYPHE